MLSDTRRRHLPDLQAVVSFPIGLLGTKLKSSIRAPRAFNCSNFCVSGVHYLKANPRHGIISFLFLRVLMDKHKRKIKARISRLYLKGLTLIPALGRSRQADLCRC